MQTEQMRALLLEWLKSPDIRQGLQFQTCVTGVGKLAQRRFSDPNTVPLPRGNISDVPHLSVQDSHTLLHVIWDLILERILLPGRGDSGWPFLSITPHGETVISSSRPVPYDPDGYLKQLKSDAQGIHDTVIRYAQEAVMTFKTGNYLASSVMLGAASEKIFDELSVAIPATLSDATRRSKLAEKTQRGNMKVRLNAIVGWCRNRRSALPGLWSGEEQVEDIERIADLIRRRRNEAGHPQDPPVCPSHEQMYSSLMVFPEYCKNLYLLKEWADRNPGSIS